MDDHVLNYHILKDMTNYVLLSFVLIIYMHCLITKYIRCLLQLKILSNATIIYLCLQKSEINKKLYPYTINPFYSLSMNIISLLLHISSFIKLVILSK